MMPLLVIDNRQIEVPEGTKIIEAAQQLGIFIPRFCYHPALGAVGACRVCVVKFLEGPVKGLEMSCMITAQDGMKVSTTDPDAMAFRKYIIECLMINHPHDCPVCDEGGHCLLQDLTVSGGHGIRQYQGLKRTYNDQNLGPLIQHEMNRCIQCYRCVRYYREYSGYKDLGVMGIAGRIYYGRFEEGCLDSPFSGNLIDICPTGVYTDKPSRYSGRQWDFERSSGVCIHCALGCNTTVSARYRAIARQEAGFNPVINGHFICDRGRYGFYYANLPERPRQGSINGQSVPAGQAADAAAQKIAEIEARFGASSTAIISSDRSSLETLAELKSVCQTKGWQPPGFWPGYLGDAIDTAVSSLSRDLAISMGEIGSADFIFMVGADPLNEAPMLALALRQAQRKNCSIWVADPRPIKLPFSFRHIPCRGHEMTDILEQVIHRPDTISGIDGPMIQELADAFLNCNRPVILCGTEIPAASVIAKTGALARAIQRQKACTGLFFILPHANSYGAALLFGGHQPIEGILEKIEQDEVKTVVFLESDVFEQFPDRARLERALKKLELIVAIDCLKNPLSQMAHIHVPVQSVFEAGGIYVNQEGRVQYSHMAQSGGLPISVTGQGSHPPRTFQNSIPGGDILPAGDILRDISGQVPHESRKDKVSWMEKAFPELSGLAHMLTHSKDTGHIRLYAKNQAGRLPSKPETGQSETDFEILTIASVFGDEPLSCYSPCLGDLGEKQIWISCRDAENLKITQGDEIILDLPQAPLEFKACLTDRMAPGILVIPRRHDLFWQQFDPGNRFFINQTSIHINKKE